MERLKKHTFVPMMRHLVLILALFSSIHAQRNYNKNWMFGVWYTSDPKKGEIAQLTFNDTGITSIVKYIKPIHIRSDVACISDLSGELKVWSNNCSIFNGLHDTLFRAYQLQQIRGGPGGYCQEYGGWPWDNSVMILPVPQHKEQYQMFYLSVLDASLRELDSLRYPFISYLNGASIDFSNSSQGEVTESWQLLYEDTITVSHLTACRHGNGDDWWINTPMDGRPCYALHTLSDTGYAFHHKQCIGDQVLAPHDYIGQACFSPDGKYYARYCAEYGIHLFKFDNWTGLLSNPQYIPTPPEIDLNIDWAGGICFAPNSKYLYQCCGRYMYQYDLSEVDITKSRILLDTLDRTSGKVEIADFNHAALGPDGRIYISGNWESRYLHVINRPNCRGKDCELVQQAIPLPVRNSFGIPNVPHFMDWKDVSTACIPSGVKNEIDYFKQVYISLRDNVLQILLDDQLMGSQVELMNMDGKLMASMNVENKLTSYSIVDYPDGIYLLKITKNGIQKTYKVVNVK